MKKFGITQSWQRQVDGPGVANCGNPELDEKSRRDLQNALESIAEDRFGPNTGRAFEKLRKITKYNQGGKKDGGFLQRALTEEGRIIEG